MQPLVGDAGRVASRTARKPESMRMQVVEASAMEPAATRAEVRRLYDHAGATTVAGIAVALCVWLLFEREARESPLHG